MKNTLSILALLLLAQGGAWAQQTISGIPTGWAVSVDGSNVTIADGVSAAIAAGKTVTLTNNSGKTVTSIVAVKSSAAATAKEYIDLTNINRLALAYKPESSSEAKAAFRSISQSAQAKGASLLVADDENGTHKTVEKFLFNYTDEGVLQDVKWNFDFSDIYSALNEEDSAYLKSLEGDLTIGLDYVYSVGEEWLWMSDTKLEFMGDVSALVLNDAREQAIGGMIGKISRNYMMRISDGALFAWDNAPTEFKIRGDYQSYVDICGLVEPYEDGFVYVNNNNQIVLVKAEGEELVETVISPEDTKAMYVAPTTDGYLATILTDDATLNGGNNYGTGEMCLFTTEGVKLTIGDYLRYNTYGDTTLQKVSEEEYQQKIYECYHNHDMFVLNGKVYTLSRAADDRAIQFKEVVVNEGTVTTNLVATYIDPEDILRFYEMHQGHTGIAFPVFNTESGNMSYIDGGSVFTFRPATGNVTAYDLPLHYDRSPVNYYDGVSYKVPYDSYYGETKVNFPSYYYVCDLSKTSADVVAIDWSGITDEQRDIDAEEGTVEWRYWPGVRYFEAHANLKNGGLITYIIPTTGDDKAKAQVAGDTSGMIISDLVDIK